MFWEKKKGIFAKYLGFLISLLYEKKISMEIFKEQKTKLWENWQRNSFFSQTMPILRENRFRVEGLDGTKMGNIWFIKKMRANNEPVNHYV